jgi:predicted nucleic acid-binding protein
MIFVADAGPLISFARADRLELLHQVVGELWIPEAVYQELVTQGAGRPRAEEASRGEWIRRKPITQQAMVRTLPSPLGAGEREAIILTQELGAVLLVDDPDARDTAARLGILCLGSLGMLREAKLKGIIHAVKLHLDALRAHQFRLSDTLYRDFLQQIDEA